MQVQLAPEQRPPLRMPLSSETYEKVEAARRADLIGCVESLRLCVEFALTRPCGGARVLATVLASCYNGYRVKLDVTDLCNLDAIWFEHAMNVIRLRVDGMREPHTYFVNGNTIFERLIADYGLEKKRRAS